MNSSIRIGFDLDGVIAAHPFGGLFLALRKWKERWLFKSHNSRYYYPDTSVEKFVWKLINNRRRPAKGAGKLLEHLQNTSRSISHPERSSRSFGRNEAEGSLSDRFLHSSSDLEDFGRNDEKNNFGVYLVTTRFGFLENITINWLKKYHLHQLFHQVIINKKDLEPNEFKVKTVKELGLDYFVDDDLETLNILSKNTETKLIWLCPPHVNPAINKNPEIVSCDNLSSIYSSIKLAQ
mgnify:CR=1 FL=1